MLEQFKELHDKNASQCDITNFDFEVEPGVNIKVYVIRPKNLPKTGNPANIDAHGGGAVLLDAEMFNMDMAKHAILKKCIIFNVNYRKGPETKCPGGQQDFAKVIEHVYNNADKWGVDRSKICASGVSGGGWICLGATILLARARKAHMIKAQFLWTPMISDSTSGCKKEDLKEYEMEPETMTAIFKLLAKDFTDQKNDENLYPGLCPDEIFEKLPPMAIFTAEFDFLRRDCLALKERALKHGKLLDFHDTPGC